jgi:hypothetical protein
VGDIMIPATPEPGTADPNPLVTQDDYQMVTGDCTVDPVAFDYFLADALDQVQRKLTRTLLYANYVERLFLYRNGFVYGSAIPYDTSVAVVNPAMATEPDPNDPLNASNFQGYAVWVGWYTALPMLPWWSGVVPPQTDISYWGGFVGPGSDLAGERLLPAGLKRAICKVVWYMAHPVFLPGLPGGLKSVSVGGVSMSGDLTAMTMGDKALGCELKRWRHPMARHFAGQTSQPVSPI